MPHAGHIHLPYLHDTLTAQRAQSMPRAGHIHLPSLWQALGPTRTALLLSQPTLTFDAATRAIGKSPNRYEAGFSSLAPLPDSVTVLRNPFKVNAVGEVRANAVLGEMRLLQEKFGAEAFRTSPLAPGWSLNYAEAGRALQLRYTYTMPCEGEIAAMEAAADAARIKKDDARVAAAAGQVAHVKKEAEPVKKEAATGQADRVKKKVAPVKKEAAPVNKAAASGQEARSARPAGAPRHARLGRISTEVVGLRHYSGCASANEAVRPFLFPRCGQLREFQPSGVERGEAATMAKS